MSRYLVNIEGQEYDIELVYRSEKYYALLGDKEVEVSLHQLGESRALVLIDGTSYEIDVRHNGYDNKKVVFMKGMEIVADVEDYNLAQLRKTAGISSEGALGKYLKAAMPGLVVEVGVKSGDVIKKGQSLLIIEAMKMENIIKAPGDGIVKAIHVEAGMSVDKGDNLLEFE